MGIFDRLFRREPGTWKYAKMVNGMTPIFSQFGTDIYASDVVQQAVSCIVNEFKKLNPMHVRMVNGEPVPVQSVLQTALNNPNQLMTTNEFLERSIWLLLLNYNLFIFPTWSVWEDEKTGVERWACDGLYPLKPNLVEFQEDDSGEIYCRFEFSDFETTLPYKDVIHVRYSFSSNEYMGGNAIGKPDHRALLKTLQLNQTLLTGVAKALNASYSINGIVRYNTVLDEKLITSNLQNIEQRLRAGDSGILPLDMKADFIPVNNDVKLVDKDTLEFIDQKILRYFGVPLPILYGDYKKETYEAFYQKTLEPLIISFSQAFTKKLFTDRERAFGNQVKLYPKDLIFMTVDETLRMVELLSTTGALTENEKRTAFGLRPLPELAGKRYISLNWIDADNAGRYQVGKDGDQSGGDADE